MTKTLQLNNTQSSRILQAFFEKILKNKIAEERFNENEESFFTLKDPTNQGYNEKCPLQIPRFFMENPNQERPLRSKNVNPEEKYKALAEEAHGGRITDNCLRVSLKILQDSLNVFMCKKNNEIRAFEANANGTKRKALQDCDKIARHARFMQKTHPKTLFLTLTQKVNPGEDDIIMQYQMFTKTASDFLAFMAKKFDCKYEVVFESTKRGYAHSHIVLHFKKMPDVAKIVKRKYSADVYGGAFREWIKNHWYLGTSKLEISDKRSPVSYLLKYITKFAYSDMTKIINKQEWLTADERKGCLTLLLPILSKCRRFNMSHLSKEERAQMNKEIEQEEENKRTKSFLQNAKYKPAKARGSALLRRRRSLDCSCINSELPCESVIKVLGYQKFKNASFGEVEDFKELSDEFKEHLFSMGTPISCEGCIFTHFKNEMLNGNDPWFHKKASEAEADAEAYGQDYWLFTPEEQEQRKELLKKYDERVLPFIVENMQLTMYKKNALPKVKITFSKPRYGDSDERAFMREILRLESPKYSNSFKGKFVNSGDLYEDTWKLKIHDYLLSPSSRYCFDNQRMECTRDIFKDKFKVGFEKDEINAAEFAFYTENERRKLKKIR